MGLVDIVLGVILIFAFFRGWKKGLFVTLASLIGLIGGVYAAVHFSDYAAEHISRWFDWNDRTTNLVAFAVTFVAVVSLVSMAGQFLTKIADLAFLGILNKLLGGVFSTLTYAFVISVVIMFGDSWDATEELISDEKQESSILYPKIASIAPLVLPYILEEVDSLKKDQGPNSDPDDEVLSPN